MCRVYIYSMIIYQYSEVCILYCYCICLGQVQLDITDFLSQFVVCTQILNFDYFQGKITPGDLAILKERNILHKKS